METPLFRSEEDIKFHLCALRRLAFADGVFCDVEKTVLTNTIRAYCDQFPDLVFSNLIEIDFSEEDFTNALERLKESPVQAKLLIKDLVTLGFVDNDYCAAERAMVANYGTKMGISLETINEIETLTEEMLTIIKRLNFVIQGNISHGTVSIED